MWDGTRFVTFTTSNGLPGNRIAFVIEDETRHLWLGIGSGLLRIGLDEFDTALQTPGHRLRYRMYDASDGLHGTPVRRGTPNVARTPDGTLWFGTSVGISIVDPERLAHDRPPRAPRIEDVVINGVRTQADSGLRVPSDTSSVQIEYTALSLSAPSKLRFRRRLDGIDRDWIDDVARQAAYAHLPPGTYTFRLSAGNGTGVWSEPTVWTFRVLPAWYQTWTFAAGCVGLGVVLLGGVWRLREHKIRTQFSAVLAERARVGREIHDTLLQSLVGLAFQIDNLSADVPPTAGAIKQELERIRHQVDHYIDEAQQSIWDLRAPRLESVDVATALRERAEPIIDAAGVAFDFKTTGVPRSVAPRVQQQLLRIVQEAIMNAIRHAAPRNVRLELAFGERLLCVYVTDDGRGFDPQAPRVDGDRHWGLSIMHERALQIGGRLAIASAPGRGTRVEMTVPLASEA